MLTGFGQRLRAFIPQPLHAGNREIWTACVGVLLGLAVTEAVCRYLPGGGPALVASMGASALLAFALPSSPLAQPWAMIGGNVLSALVGLACAAVFPHTGLAAGMAVALSIAAMFLLRCLHPPGGALAMAMVLTPASHGAAFIAGPVLANAVLLTLLADAFNRQLRRGRFQPLSPAPSAHRTADPLPGERIGFSPEDLDRALDEHGELLDIRREDLLGVFRSAEWHAYHRRFGQVRCLDIMARDVVSVHEDTPLAEVWTRLALHKVKALPVVDGENRLRGIVTVHDILLGGQGHAFAPSLSVRQGDEPVSVVMTAEVRSVTPAQSIADLAGLFSDGGLHHLPVIDGERRVVGMISQSDLVAALFKVHL
ncbi:MAG: HPP family protein [Fluviicoccus sp.]|uniref:HPP family protein n=1 Tax=Fluviicoccus sp. TaxID=2003552 RepID=UPI0027285C4C|nr:HPP family protein [Fluviicoccus sp.]MDO8330599.1 HPP family protein [Fluviicoccus sp.]